MVLSTGARDEMKKIWLISIIVLLAVFAFASCGDVDESDSAGSVGNVTETSEEGTEAEHSTATETAATTATSSDANAGGEDFAIPAFADEPSVEINHNVPMFDDKLKTGKSFETYGALDKHGRCTTAIANLSTDTQPGASEERGDISSVHPSGWKSEQGWERCHLIGWQLSGENDNPRNLVTGTHYMNVEGMLPYENMVEWYISDTGNHVLYEVTPIFEGKNMVCAGVHMQGYSVEDDGAGVSFNIFCFNVKPGYDINYKTVEVTIADEEIARQQSFDRGYVLNTSTMKFHYPSCSSVEKMAEHNKEYVETSREELIEKGYSPCGNCEP